MSDMYTIPRSLNPASLGLWPPNDTEESVMGTDLHQLTIMNLRWGMNEIAAVLTPPGGPAPWQALSQTIVRGFPRRDGSLFKTLPDVFVYHHAIGRRRGSVSIDGDGPPALIVEVLSESTYEVDIDLVEGKGYGYARAGVREYLVLDPTGEFLPALGRAWRLSDDVYLPWAPAADGRWRSREIAVDVGVKDGTAAVYSRDGRRQLREGEIANELARQENELARKDGELAELRRLVEELRGER